MSVAVDFFEALYPEPEGDLALLGLPSARVTWTKPGSWVDVEAAAREIVRSGQEAYFGIALQDQAAAIRAATNGRVPRPEHVRGKDETAVLLSCLFADIDCVSPGKANVPTIDEALAQLRALPFAPSIIVRSGWGLHGYWLFREPLRLENDDVRQKAQLLSEGWQRFIRDAWGEHGWKLDSTADLARVGRIPGTLNLKHNERRLVTIESLDTDRRYNPSDFEPFLGGMVPSPRRVPACDWIPLDNVAGAMVAQKELEIAAVAMKAGEERHSTALRFFAQLRDGRVSRETASSFLPVFLSVAKAMPRERDRAMTERELRDIVDEVYSTQPREPAPRAQRIASEWADAPAEYPEIQLHAGELPGIVDQAERALLDAGIYQRGGQLVRAIRSAPVTVRGVWRDEGALSIVTVSAPHLAETLTRRARFKKLDARAKGWKPTNCPGEVATTLLARVGLWNQRFLPSLVGLMESPTLRPDGSILDSEGYDAETGLLVDFGGTRFAPIPLTPTQLDAARALEELADLVKDFPFVDETDRAAAVAALLTALVRRSIPTAPLFAFTAPKPRSGKSLLADLVGLLNTGRRPATVTFTGDAPEEKKRLMSLLQGGDPVISFDNVSDPIGGDALCTILTQATWTDRILGRNDAGSAATVPTAATFLATGNNLVVEADLAARTLPCRIDPRVERPEERAFDVNLYEEVPRRRSALVVAGLTILRAYHVAGRPEQPCPTWGGFEAWTRWVRDPLVWLGLEDPVKGRRHVEANDPIHQKLVGLLTTWNAAVRGVPHTTADIVKASGYQNAEAEALRGALLEIAGTPHGDVNLRTLGRFLATYVDRIESGLVLRRDGRRHGGAPAWRVLDIEVGGSE